MGVFSIIIAKVVPQQNGKTRLSENLIFNYVYLIHNNSSGFLYKLCGLQNKIKHLCGYLFHL